ncbi:hypothetical protein A3Q56_01391 [Intoshia linei]|uniref:Conserved oligomeric Golgi complex subunit 8 n=1 Tax=Intoshia linei TaxID=1819745 RepID=A0A177BBC4_9BILA|nr:hypothetical protein A3Q56_01391 [Intoshia linei]
MHHLTVLLNQNLKTFKFAALYCIEWFRLDAKNISEIDVENNTIAVQSEKNELDRQNFFKTNQSTIIKLLENQIDRKEKISNLVKNCNNWTKEMSDFNNLVDKSHQENKKLIKQMESANSIYHNFGPIIQFLTLPKKFSEAFNSENIKDAIEIYSFTESLITCYPQINFFQLIFERIKKIVDKNMYLLLRYIEGRLNANKALIFISALSTFRHASNEASLLIYFQIRHRNISNSVANIDTDNAYSKIVKLLDVYQSLFKDTIIICHQVFNERNLLDKTKTDENDSLLYGNCIVLHWSNIEISQLVKDLVENMKELDSYQYESALQLCLVYAKSLKVICCDFSIIFLNKLTKFKMMRFKDDLKSAEKRYENTISNFDLNGFTLRKLSDKFEEEVDHMKLMNYPLFVVVCNDVIDGLYKLSHVTDTCGALVDEWFSLFLKSIYQTTKNRLFRLLNDYTNDDNLIISDNLTKVQRLLQVFYEVFVNFCSKTLRALFKDSSEKLFHFNESQTFLKQANIELINKYSMSSSEINVD